MSEKRNIPDVITDDVYYEMLEAGVIPNNIFINFINMSAYLQHPELRPIHMIILAYIEHLQTDQTSTIIIEGRKYVYMDHRLLLLLLYPMNINTRVSVTLLIKKLREAESPMILQHRISTIGGVYMYYHLTDEYYRLTEH